MGAKGRSSFLKNCPTTFAEKNVIKVLMEVMASDTAVVMTGLLLSCSVAKDLICSPEFKHQFDC